MRGGSPLLIHGARAQALPCPPYCATQARSPTAQVMLSGYESPSLVLVINDTKLLISCVKCFESGISNTRDEGVCGKEWWSQDHQEMVHRHEIMIMVEMHII
jgi:hypothetical protein